MGDRMDGEVETMAENDACLFEKSSCESSTGDDQSMTQIYERPRQLGILVCEDPTSSETSWTDEKHSLYLNSIEDAFVTSLYEQGYYTHPCKRWQADKEVAASAFSQDLNEEVESGFSYDYKPYAFSEENERELKMPRSYSDFQNYSICCSNESSQEQDMNGRTKKRKYQQKLADPGKEISQAFEEVSSGMHNHKHASRIYQGRDQFTQNKEASEHLTRTLSNSEEDQVVPNIDDTSRKDGKL